MKDGLGAEGADDERLVRLAPSAKYHALLDQYEEMARDGYDTSSGRRIEDAYSRQEALRFRHELKRLFETHEIKDVLDYGGGGGDWRKKLTPEGPALANFVGVDDYRRFEPARSIDERREADCVVCFDVMEHIFVSDVAYVLADIFAAARKLVVFNIACYAADARLPNGENAHSTVRSPDWWRGAMSAVAAAHPEIAVALYLSTSYRRIERDAVYRHADLAAAKGFAR